MSKYGIYTVGNSITAGQLSPVTDVAQGCRFRYLWKDVETSDGVYNFSGIQASVMAAYNAGKYIWLQFLVSPCTDPNVANYSCPAFLFSAPYNVPKVFTSTSGANLFYPHYTNTNFKTKHKAFLTAIFAWIATLPSGVRAKIVLYLSSEGKTGDPGPYNGTPTNPAYVISDADWNTHKYDLWLHQYNAIAANSLGVTFMINPGNDGENLQYGLDNFAVISFKNGDNSHNWDFAGSINLTRVFNGFRDPATGGDFINIGGGEFENTQDASYYTVNPQGYTFGLVCFNLAAGSAIITIAPAKMISDRFAYNLFNEFAQFRNIADADRGLLTFRDKIDFDDVVRFPESTFQPVIDPARLGGANGYTQKYNNLISSGKPAALIADTLTSLRITYINPARIAAIRAAFPGRNYIGVTTNRDYDVNNEDYGFDIIKGNFERYLHMYDQFGTSESGVRFQYTGTHGRYVLLLTDAKPKWYFYTPILINKDYQVRLQIIHCNKGTGSFKVYCNDGTGKIPVASFTCSNTNAYIEQILNITHLFGGRQIAIPGTTDKCDFTIEKDGTGDDIAFSMMRIYRVAENIVNHPPVVDAGLNQNITLPTSSVTLSGTASDIDGDSLFYNWVQVSGPNTATIVSFTSITTNVTGLIAGVYVFKLKVLDARGLETDDLVTITVNTSTPVNVPPVCNPGANQSITASSTTLDGSGSTDSDGTIVTYAWIKVSGPTGGAITSPAAASTTITGLVPGTYTYNLTVTDNDGATDSKNVTITVSVAGNTAPNAVSASATYTITLPVDSVDLDFSGSNDPDGTIVGRTLTRVSGPTTFLPVNPGSATPTISNMIAGVYVFRHTVTDNDGATDSVDVTITVNPAVVTDPQPPTAIITPPDSITENVAATFGGSASFDNDGSIVSYAWSITGSATATIDDDTAQNINIIAPAGNYRLTLIVTDDDDLTDEATYDFTVLPTGTTEIIQTGLPKLEFLDFIVDSDLRSASIKDNNVVFDAEPTPFKQHADGWKDTTIAFGTNEKYFSANRSFSLPLKFVGDAAKVLRTRAYKGAGYEEELYYMLFRWNRTNGIHELEYKGKIDLSKVEDRPLEGVTVNTIEGGTLSYLNANDAKSYEIPCDETNPDIVKVRFDGINLEDKLNYGTFEAELDTFNFLIPLVFLTNEGDSVGVIRGNEDPERIDLNTEEEWDEYFQNGSNYPFTSIYAITDIILNGKIRFETLTNVSPDAVSGFGVVRFYAIRSDVSFSDADKIYLGQVDDTDSGISEFVIPETTFDLNANEKFYLYVKVIGFGSGAVHIIKILAADQGTTSVTLQYRTRNAESLVYAIRPYQFLKQMNALITETRFTADSVFLKANNNIVLFCGDALRNTRRDVVPFYKLATTFSDFFKAYNSFYNLGIKIVDDVLFIEPKADIYNDTSNILLDLGEVSELIIRFTEERIVNTVKCGFTDQDYGQRNGKYEFNTARQYGLPVLAVQRELDISCPYRGDAFGQEFIRDVLENKDTTDNTGDKNVFVAVIDDSNTSTEFYRANKTGSQVYASGDKITFQSFTGSYFTNNGTDFTFIGIAQVATASVFHNIDNSGSPVLVELTKNGVTIGSYFIAAAAGNDITFDVTNVALAPTDVFAVKTTNPGSTLTSTINEAQLEFTFTSVVYDLKRDTYDDLSGVLDDSIYNVDISPARQLRAHGSYLKGLLYQLQYKQVTFQTGSKNVNLSTTVAGVTITENVNIPVADLIDNFFIPYEAEFKAVSPYTFAATLAAMNAGLIKFSYNGYTLYGLPIGDMSAKPATDEPQTWKILLHKNTSLTTLLNLGSSGTFVSLDNNRKMIQSADLNPVHFVVYNKELDPRYHHQDIYDDWVHNRHERFASQPAYLQPWQNSDTMNLQIITAGLGQVEVYIYDKLGELYDSKVFSYVADNAVLFPAIKQQLSIELTDYPEGEYIFVIRSGTTNLMISEWQSIKADHADTYLFEYYHTTNKLDAYFDTWRPSLRCAAFMHEWQPDSSFVTYEDEPADLEMLRGRPTLKRIIALGGATGIADWMANKLNQIFLLNRVSIDGVRYTRNTDSKFEVEERQGYPLNFYRVEIRKALNDTALTVNDEGVEIINGLNAYTLDAKAWGKSDGTITITTRNE